MNGPDIWKRDMSRKFDSEMEPRQLSVSFACYLTRRMSFEFQPFANMKKGNEKGFERWHGTLKAYRGPVLRVWEIQVEGPIVEQWPPSGHEKLYGKLTAESLSPSIINQRLQWFTKVAFRRPPLKDELSPSLDMVQAKLNQGISDLEALKLGFQTILTAPGFLYLKEGTGELDEYALASRLSYFLWSSMPDEKLINLADGARKT